MMVLERYCDVCVNLLYDRSVFKEFKCEEVRF